MFRRPHIGRPSGASIGRTPTQHKQNEVGGQAKRSIEKRFPETNYPRVYSTLHPLRDSFTLDLDQAFSQSDDRSVGATESTQLLHGTSGLDSRCGQIPTNDKSTIIFFKKIFTPSLDSLQSRSELGIIEFTYLKHISERIQTSWLGVRSSYQAIWLGVGVN